MIIKNSIKNRETLEFKTPYGIQRQKMPGGKTNYWYTIINALDPAIQKMDNDANLRLVDPAHSKKMSDIVLKHKSYAQSATPLTCFLESTLLALHPDTNQWVDAYDLDPNTADKVRQIRGVLNRLDGNHRAAAFGIVAQKLIGAEDAIDPIYVRLAICSGVPEDDAETRTDICVGHNAVKAVPPMAQYNKRGHYDQVFNALGDLAGAVSWYGGSKKSNPNVIYQPHEIFKMMGALVMDDFVEKRAESDWRQLAGDLEPVLPVLQTVLKAFEIIAYESEDLFISAHGGHASAVSESTFRRCAFKKTIKTATLGIVKAHPMQTGFALLILHSIRSFFLRAPEGYALAMPESELLARLRKVLPELVNTIGKRAKTYIEVSAYLSKTDTKPVGRGKNKTEVVFHVAGRDCTKTVDAFLEQSMSIPVGNHIAQVSSEMVQ